MIGDVGHVDDTSEWWQVNLEGPLPGRVADLVSVGQDLQFVVACCTEWLSLHDQDADGSTTGSALWEAATVAYGRCFHNGKGHLAAQRPRLQIPVDLVDKLGGRAVHEAVMETRNRHVAHRVNSDEQIKVTGLLAPPPQPPRMVGVAAWGMRHVGPESEIVESLRALADRLRLVVEQDRSNLQQRIMDLAPQQLDQLYTDADR